jgi:hypothetical protein
MAASAAAAAGKGALWRSLLRFAFIWRRYLTSILVVLLFLGGW